MNLEQLMNVKVVSAALHAQRIEAAPASVSVITAADIEKYGYRTLGEALDSVKGFYVTTDRSYDYLGSRGLSIPADYGSRFLLLINGHSMPDPIYDSSGLLGGDLPLELNLVKQIEIVHGPAAALYGSNAVVCTINIITKDPSEMPAASITLDTGNQGEKKGIVTWSGSWRSVRALTSLAIFNDGGEGSIYIPGYDDVSTNFGRAINMDAQRGYHFFSTASWRNWTFSLLSGVRDKILPVTGGATIFNDRGNREIDSTAFAEAAYSRQWRRSRLDWRISYDRYHYWGLNRYLLEGGSVEDNREDDSTVWLGSKLTYRFDAGRAGSVTVGTEARIDLQTLQSNYDVQPVAATFLRINKPDRRMGYFVQDELPLSSQWTAVLGARLDTSHYRDSSVSPRVGLIWAASRQTTLKLLYGTSFRNPNAYEMFFADGLTQSENRELHPERGKDYEVVIEHKLAAGMKLSAGAFRTDLHDLIVAGRDRNGLIQFQNLGENRLLGVDAEISGRWRDIDFSGSVAIQNDYDTADRSILLNSPRQVAKLRLAVPLMRNHLTVTGALKWLGRRQDMNGEAISGAFEPDLTFTTNHLWTGLNLQFGIRNLFNRTIYDPVALNAAVDVLPRPGRTLFLRVIWRTDD
jgi:outer membrane receptor protein involved in Fe transport